MARRPPNIVISTALKKRDRTDFKNFILQVIEDVFIFQWDADFVELIDNKFVLYLFDKRFVIDVLRVDNVEDYIDIFLFGIRQPKIRYIKNGEVYEVSADSSGKIEYITGETDGVTNTVVSSTFENATGIKITFLEDISADPSGVIDEFNDKNTPNPFTIRGKITKISEDAEMYP